MVAAGDRGDGTGVPVLFALYERQGERAFRVLFFFFSEYRARTALLRLLRDAQTNLYIMRQVLPALIITPPTPPRPSHCKI